MTRGQKRMRAMLALLGTIIGAGVFGVPAMIGAWGIPMATLGFIGVSLLVMSVHLLFTEAVLAHGPAARVAGFARHYLGPTGGMLTGAAQTLQIFGTNLAYIILGGEFLAVLALALGIELPLIAWQMFFWIVGAVIVVSGLGWLGRVEAFLTWILVAVMLLVMGVLAGKMEWITLFALPVRATFEPYGVFLFSLFGYNVIPELEDMTGGRRDDLRLSVIRATLAASVLTYAFGVTAWLASGGSLGRSAADIVALLPPGVRIAVPIFGLLAIITSYLTTAYDLGRMFQIDYHLPSGLSWIASLGIPLALLFIVQRDFLTVIGFVGALLSGAVAISCALMGRAALRKTLRARQGTPNWWVQEVFPLVVAAALFAGGLAWFILS